MLNLVVTQGRFINKQINKFIIKLTEKYSLEERSYNLDSSKIMEIIINLEKVLSMQKIMHELDYPNSPIPHLFLDGNGRKMVMFGEFYNKEGILNGCKLSELEISEKYDSLILKTFKEEGITTDPNEIYLIGEQYSINK